MHTSDYLCYLGRKQIATVYSSLAVYLLLFSAFYYLHNPITASGACYRMSACIEYRSMSGRVEAAACCNMGWILAENGVWWDKKLEACIDAEGGHSKHWPWHCLLDILVATHHNQFLSEPPTFEGLQQTCRAPLRWWHSDLWCKWSIWCRCPAAEDYWMSDSCCRLDVGQSAPTEFR